MAKITMMARMLTTAMTSGLELGEGVGVISEDGLGLRVEEDGPLPFSMVNVLENLVYVKSNDRGITL